MPYSAKAVANYFIEKAAREGVPLTPMKLQKLVYFAQGWHLALRDRPLIDEQIEAWQYGPVVRSLYRAFRECGDRPIREQAMDYGSQPEPTVPTVEEQPADAEYTRKFLDRIWQIYGGYTAIQLSNMTHEPGTPWDAVRKEYEGAIPLGTDIPRETIRRYFQERMREPASA
jgi:uncharacterized phage-associated protein